MICENTLMFTELSIAILWTLPMFDIIDILSHCLLLWFNFVSWFAVYWHWRSFLSFFKVYFRIFFLYFPHSVLCYADVFVYSLQLNHKIICCLYYSVFSLFILAVVTLKCFSTVEDPVLLVRRLSIFQLY